MNPKLTRLRGRAQLTIPHWVIEKTKLEEGDYLDFEVLPDGKIVIDKYELRKPKPPAKS